MNLEDILYVGGVFLLSFSIVRVYAKKRGEIAENFQRVYEGLSLKLKKVNMYEAHSDYRELQDMVSKFDECENNSLLLSLIEWYHAKKLMKKYNL
mgnify:CR=1 FL=1